MLECEDKGTVILWNAGDYLPSDTPSYPRRVNHQQHHCKHLISCSVLSMCVCFKLTVTTSSGFIQTSAELHGDFKCRLWLEIWIRCCPYLYSLATLAVLHICVLAWPVHLECHRRCGHWIWLLSYMCVLYCMSKGLLLVSYVNYIFVCVCWYMWNVPLQGWMSVEETAVSPVI